MVAAIINLNMNISSKNLLLLCSLLGIALSIFVGCFFYEKETRAIEMDFQNDVEDKVAVLESEMRINMEVLYALKGLFESSEDVSASEFSNISKQILLRHPDIQALLWTPKVKHKNRRVYEKHKTFEAPGYEITERIEQGQMSTAGERPLYYPIDFIEPLSRNERALGFDLGSQRALMQTLQKSKDFDQVLSTGLINLVHTPQAVFLTFIPIYQGTPVTIEKRQQQLQGFISGVFIIEKLFERAMQRTNAADINFKLLDISDKQEVLLLRSYEQEFKESYQAPFSYQKSIETFSGRQWAVYAQPSSDYISERRSMVPVTSSLLGIILVLSSTIYTLALIARNKLVEQTVSERTDALNAAKKELEVLTRTDALTKIANRRYFDQRLDLEWKRAVREKSTLSVIMIDIDYFKLFNDRYGHPEGDFCLIEVAAMLQKSFSRSSDFVARYGGEEFVAILPQTENAAEVAERCRKNIESLRIEHKSSKVSNYVSVSLGAASLCPTGQCRMVDLVNRADRALYQAKESGRNKFFVLTD
ncbi:diguanylate cyclase [Psychromonas aquimarina]|uniref:diguanylate cyclase n=1 Tax=Psychromonas aquimarina TaxID=444919 RepID=UPI0004217148|nr:diguanylate cyclase [Psychromonas aquimarina]